MRMPRTNSITKQGRPFSVVPASTLPLEASNNLPGVHTQLHDLEGYASAHRRLPRLSLEAHRRGVKVEVILDKSNRTDRYSAATFTQDYGIPTFIDESARHRAQQNHHH